MWERIVLVEKINIVGPLCPYMLQQADCDLYILNKELLGGVAINFITLSGYEIIGCIGGWDWGGIFRIKICYFNVFVGKVVYFSE